VDFISGLIINVQVAAESDISLRGRCTELENVISNLHRELDLQAAEHASRLAVHMAASQDAAEQAEQHIGQLMADTDDLRAQLKVCRLHGFHFANCLIIYIS